MNAYVPAMLFVVAAHCSAASAQTGSPPGGAIEHVGPVSPSGQSSNEPLAQVPALTAAQKAAIFSSVTLDKSRSRASENFNVAVGEQVPPTVALHPLPTGAIA